jgi:2-desacetyl-2-hydroxyethyl bacteriochlorophyllide A dehydrogenase
MFQFSLVSNRAINFQSLNFNPMHQWICNKPGKIGKQEAEIPHCNPGFSLLRVLSIGICGTDIHAFAGVQPYFNYPRILGHELAVEIIESNAFTQGELATIIPYFNCENCDACLAKKSNCCENIQVFGVHIDGGMREYILIEDRFVMQGRGLNTDELVLVEPFSIAAHGLRRAGLKLGDKVLVLGAGPIGLFTILLAKIQGAIVEVAEPNTARLQFCKDKIGVKEVLSNSFDIVIDATGNRSAINSGFAKMAHGGKYILIGLQKETITFSHPEFHKREGTLLSSRNATIEDFKYVMRLFRDGMIKAETFISKRFKRDETTDVFLKINENSTLIVKSIIDLTQ